MTQTVAQFAERCLKAGAVMKVAEREMVRAAALTVTTAERSAISDATHGSMFLSGVGKKGAKVGASFLMLPSAQPTAVVRATGQLHLLERPTKAHTIVPKRRRALATHVGVFARVQSPGTKGKHPWEKGLAVGLPLAEAAAVAGARQSVVKAVIG